MSKKTTFTLTSPSSASLLSLSLALGLVGCSGGATLHVTMPQTNPLANPAAQSKAMISGTPTNFDGFSCFAINVLGPGISQPTCSPMGILTDFVAPGQSVKVVVPSGNARQIQLIGVMMPAGVPCPSAAQAQTPPPPNSPNSVAPPFLYLGSTTKDIFADAAVTIQAKYDPSNPQQVNGGCNNQNGPVGVPMLQPGLVAWYNTQEFMGMGAGTSIGIWHDLSGQSVPNHLMQSTTANMPTVSPGVQAGFPSLHFAASSIQYMQVIPAPLSMQTPNQTIFIAGASTNNVQNQNFFTMDYTGGGVSGLGFQYSGNYFTGLAFTSGGSAVNATSNTPTQGPFHILDMHWDPAAMQVTLNSDGTTVSTSSPTANGTAASIMDFNVGAGGGGSYPLNGDILELIVYNQTLSAAQIHSVECFLQSKYMVAGWTGTCP